MATEKTNDLKTETRAIASIVVGERFREGVGDEDQFKALQESIVDLGVLEPIVIKQDGTLVDGFRRLEACRARGIEQIPVVVPETLEEKARAMRAQRDTNICHLPMKPDEKTRLGLALLEEERARALDRKAQGGRGGLEGTGARASTSSQAGKTRDIVAEAVGFRSGETFRRAKEVVEAAEDEAETEEVRAVAREAIVDMRKTGKVTPAFNKVRAARGMKGAGGGTRPRHANGTGKPRLKPDAFMNALVTAMSVWPGEYKRLNFDGYQASAQDLKTLKAGRTMLTRIIRRFDKEEA